MSGTCEVQAAATAVIDPGLQDSSPRFYKESVENWSKYKHQVVLMTAPPFSVFVLFFNLCYKTTHFSAFQSQWNNIIIPFST